MALRYDPAPEIGALVQGEVLEVAAPHGVKVAPTLLTHRWLVVMNNVCDLRWDFDQRPDSGTESGVGEMRPEGTDSTTDRPEQAEGHHALVPHVFLCDLIDPQTLARRMDYNEKALTKALERIHKSDELRFHAFASAAIEGGGSLREVIIDFKKVFSVPTSVIYDAMDGGAIARTAVIPAIYVHALVQRFHSYLSRVGLPE